MLLRYLVLIAAIILFGGALALIHFVFPKKEKLINTRIIPLIIIVICLVRFMCFKDVQIGTNWQNFAYLGGSSSKFLNLMGELCVWFEITAMLFTLMRPFFGFKTASFYNKFISIPILIISIGFLKQMELQMVNTLEVSVLSILLPIEIGGLLALSVYYAIADWKVKISKHSYCEVAVCSVLANIATMPSYIPMFFFGPGNINYHPLDFNIYHRGFLYLAVIIIPLGIYFAFRNSHKDKIRYVLIFISLGTMLNFMAYHKYDTILAPWDWPLHLCNTAMLISPICLIFNRRKLFYFTYFINVFGALLAMCMPNYAKLATLFEPSVIRFWVNHCMAYAMPLLGVALKVFDRPKLKQYKYSAIAFGCYFLLMLVCNTLFTAFGHKTDFFFLNTDYIGDKLGGWAKDLFRMNFVFTINGVKFELHPLYQVLYFFVYILLGLGVWFVYQLFFDISDNHYALMLKLKGIRVDRLALQSTLNGRSIEEPMEKDAGVKLELKDFSKKYSLNKYYSVKHANLKVNGGEVFGFLGPNGAGKSTIIKSVVGILPISEGSINICGFDVKTQPVQAKSCIGFVPDHYALYEKLSGREYLNYIADIYEVSKEEREKRLNEYVKLFELEGSIDNKIKTYSHGMKQKITIISALIHNPKVWILDEPLTGLDPTSIFQVKECMKRHAANGNVVFFSSHLIDIVEKLCDRIAIIKKGEIQTITTVAEIEKNGSTLEDFYLETIGDNVVRKQGE